MADFTPTDVALRAKLREFPVPPGLRTRLLANAPVRPAPFWRAPAFLTAAAVLVVVGMALAWLLPAQGFTGFRAEMVRYVRRDYHIEVHTATFAELQHTFAKAGWPADYAVPAELAAAEVEGGCLLTWRGRKISQLCLEQGGHDVWLFIAAPGTFAGVPTGHATVAGLPTRSWTDGRAAYLLVQER